MRILKFVLLTAIVCWPALSDCCAVQDGAGPSADSLWIPTLSDASGRHPGSPPPVPDKPWSAGSASQGTPHSPPLLGIQAPGESAIPYDSPFHNGSPFDIQSPDLQSEMLLQSMANPTSQLPPVFVHARRTVRASERTAEIWVKLPKDSKSSVSVNFVEYPPEGDFRIFKTKMMTKETRLFYLSAKSWDSAQKRWIDLHGTLPLSPQGSQLFDYGPGNAQPSEGEILVELRHGERRIVQFVNPEASGNAAVGNHSLDSLDGTLQKHINPLQNQITEVQNHMKNQNSKLDDMKSALENHQTLTSQTAERVGKLEQAANPAHRAERITTQFLFTDAALKIAGHRVTVNGEFISIDWTSHPSSVVIAVPKSLAALPVSPFNADVTFFLQEPNSEPFATLDPIALRFSELGNHIVAEIPFNQRLAVPLSDSLVRWNKPAATYRVGAIMNYEIGLDKLDPVRVSGSLGNKVELTIAP